MAIAYPTADRAVYESRYKRAQSDPFPLVTPTGKRVMAVITANQWHEYHYGYAGSPMIDVTDMRPTVVQIDRIHRWYPR